MDDEEIEREGMAQLIPWDDAYEMKAAGTARNSAEGLKKKLQSTSPTLPLWTSRCR